MTQFSITLNRVNILFFLVCLLLMMQDHHYQHQAYAMLEGTDTLWASLNVQMLINIFSSNKWLKTRAFFFFLWRKTMVTSATSIFYLFLCYHLLLLAECDFLLQHAFLDNIQTKLVKHTLRLLALYRHGLLIGDWRVSL